MTTPIPSPLARTDRSRYRHEKSPPWQGGDLEGVSDRRSGDPALPPPNLPLAKGEKLKSSEWSEGEKLLIRPSLNDIRRLADRGQTQEALRQCQDYLRDHPPSAEAYYLAGLLLDVHDQPEQAEQSLRRAIYLQPDYHQALVELAGLLRRRGQTQAAVQLLARARRVEMRSQQSSGQHLSDFNSRSQPWKAR